MIIAFMLILNYILLFKSDFGGTWNRTSNMVEVKMWLRLPPWIMALSSGKHISPSFISMKINRQINIKYPNNIFFSKTFLQRQLQQGQQLHRPQTLRLLQQQQQLCFNPYIAVFNFYLILRCSFIFQTRSSLTMI